jgi:hypothetical protein
MIRTLNLFSALLALCVVAIFSSHLVKADDSATSQPSATTGSIAVTVLDADGNPARARLQLFAQTTQPSSDDQDADAKPKKAKPMKTGRAAKDGTFTFENIPTGDYLVKASVKKTGAKGSGTVSVTDATPAATLTINLDGGTAAATTAPSAQ